VDIGNEALNNPLTRKEHVLIMSKPYQKTFFFKQTLPINNVVPNNNARRHRYVFYSARKLKYNGHYMNIDLRCIANLEFLRPWETLVFKSNSIKRLATWVLVASVAAVLSACATPPELSGAAPEKLTTAPDYVIGARDELNIFVWQNPDLSVTVPVRPDGKISTPLIGDVQASEKTPSVLAADIATKLEKFIVDPVVTVSVTRFSGPYNQQVRIVGQAVQPMAISFNDRMTLLDAMIAVGGMTEFAAGNRSVIVRVENGAEKSYTVRLDDLLLDGDVSANVPLLPGDIIIIPESWF
jgi:polysaccharide export outer membrane protein